MKTRRMTSRRSFLRGLSGAVVALPFLESLRGDKTAKAADNVAPFAIFMREANGVTQSSYMETTERWWPAFSPSPGGTPFTEADLAASTDRATSELSPYASKLNIVKGLKYGFPGIGCGHANGGNMALTAARPTLQPGQSVNLSRADGESIDNRIVRELGAEGTEPLTLYAGRKSSYLGEVLSYRAPYDLRGAENNPYNVYMDLFGLSGVDPAELEKIRLRRKSVNDLVRGEMQSLLGRPDLSKADRDRLSLHFDSIRDLENGLICGLSDGEVANLDAMQANVENDDYIEDVIKLQCDIIALAVACGAVRAATLQLGSGNDGTQYWIDGVKQLSFHKISHRNTQDDSQGETIPGADIVHHKIDRKLLGMFRYLLDKLSAYETPSGSLLDDGVCVFMNDVGDRHHGYTNLPFILAGSAGGALRTGLYTETNGTTHNKLLSTIGAAVGCKNGDGGPLDDFGDPSLAKGRIDAIVAPGF